MNMKEYIRRVNGRAAKLGLVGWLLGNITMARDVSRLSSLCFRVYLVLVYGVSRRRPA